jgi:endonuclease/exonuclease/phosphatase family metal-dependent hydrolase
MKFISWNLNLAPVMYDRYNRKKLILKQMNKLVNYNVICFQELNSWNIGVFGYLFYKYFGEIVGTYFPLLMIILDIVFIMEGMIFNFYCYNNMKEFDKFFEDNGYQVVASHSNKYVSSGLFIAIKGYYNITSIQDYKLSSDIIHSPGLLYIKMRTVDNEEFGIYNLHQVPSLPNTTIIYKLVNLLNRIFRKKPNSIRLENYSKINNIIKINEDKQIFMLGDFNEKMNTAQYNFMMNLFNINNIKSIKFDDNVTNTCLEENVIIDYIFTNLNYDTMVTTKKDLIFSDHYAIETII